MTGEVVQVKKDPPANEGSVPGSERSPGGEHGNPLYYSCLETPMDRGAWWVPTVYRVAESQTWLKWLSMERLYSFLNVKCLHNFILSKRRSGKGTLEIKMYPVPRARHCDTRFTRRWSVTDESFHKRALGLSYTHVSWRAGHSTSAQPHLEGLPRRRGGV